MIKVRSTLNYLVVTIIIFMISVTSIFIYTSVHLKKKVIFRIVQQTELISDLITRSSMDLLADEGHDKADYETVLAYGNQIGIDDIGIFRLDGSESTFENGTKAKEIGQAQAQPSRKISVSERNAFFKAVETMNTIGVFDTENKMYVRYVPLKAESACISCHRTEGEVLAVLKIKLFTGTDIELLEYLQKLIWTLGLIVFLPVGALLISGAVIREKNRLFSQLKNSNLNLIKTYNDLNETEYYLQMILDNSRVIIITTDTQGRIVEFNKEAENLLEYAKEEVVGKDVLMLYDTPQERHEPISNGKAINGEVWEVRNREVVMKSKSGKAIHISLTLSTMVNDQGRIIGTVGVGKDISEQKMLHFKLMQSEKLAGIGTLASGIAHEINNPLAGILGMAEAIKDEDDLRLIKEYTGDIIEYTLNAKDIVRELSSYSRAANNMTESIVDVQAVIENSLRMARHSASFRDIKVDMVLRKDCHINANPVEIQQVFVNLIVNAIHAMHDQGTLILKCWEEGAFVNAVVEDTGHGISEKNLSQIFDPFFTTKPVGEGTGLGLYVVYKIIMKYGGNIDVESREGVGTKFILKFPLALEAETNLNQGDLF
ncbi:MAG: PAS domain S-box protein [Deltaproteobacteria bacterium]|nr:PAS domain S-box protein [Deltaproteobacteria bacterium]